MAFLVQFLIFSPKKQFSSQKVQKNWKSKNGIKTALTPLSKELWAIFGFLKSKYQNYSCKFGGPIKNTLKIFGFMFFLKNTINPVCYTKSNLQETDGIFFNFLNEIHDRPMVFFWENFDFFPQITDFLVKKLKKWKSKNGVKTALTSVFKELWAIFG